MLQRHSSIAATLVLAITIALAANSDINAADITFFVCSDTHYNETAEQNLNQFAGVELINSLPGTEYPQSLGSGKVDIPRGVLVLGDLIDDGAIAEKRDAQWNFWINDFGVNGEGNVKFPVYEGFGNHDLNPDRFVQKQIIDRNKKRRNLTAVSENGLHYSWDWDGVHFVQLNLHPGQKWSPRSHYGPVHDPEYSFDFLVKDLEQNVGATGRPVVLMHHYDVRDNNDWWLHEEIAAYYNAIKTYNIILILHGHTGTGIYKWNGIDVVNTGNLPGGGVFVFHITPDNRLIVAQRTPARQWERMLEKTIFVQNTQEYSKPAPKDKYELVVKDKSEPNNITFLVVSDTHYRIDTLYENTRNISAMNKIPGTPYPENLGLQSVRTPVGVIHCGDCTNDAKQWQWDIFTSDYGLDGKDGLLNFPVYEIYGNHDGSLGSPVGDGIVDRNKRRPHITNISDNDLHYSWDWDGIHFISLGTRPGIEAHPYNPHHSLEFLKQDLEEYIGNTGKAVILFHHFGFDNAHSMNWWTEEERKKYIEVIRDYNIIGIFHGHSHVCEIYSWNGIDIYNAPHMRWEPERLGFFVVNITPEIMTVAERKYDGTWGLQQQKKIFLSYKQGNVAAVVNNSKGASEITATTVQLNGKLSFMNEKAVQSDIYIYWGVSDGGTDKDKWAHEEIIGKKGTELFYRDLKGLAADTTYYYRCYAANSSGNDWADASCSFQTLSAADLDNADGATDVKMSTATLNGNLTAASVLPAEVHIYWDSVDGGEEPNSWANRISLDAKSLGNFSSGINGLNPDTVYYYRCYAKNKHGEKFANASASFRTEPAVKVNNGIGTTRIHKTTAMLSGNLVIANVAPTQAFIYWGDNDGGSTENNWDHKLILGECPVGLLRAEITGLMPETTYYYRCYASNAAGNSWAETTETFTTAADFSTFAHKMKITFSGYTRTETLRNFPVLIIFSENINDFRYKQFASSSGGDLRFADANDVQLSYEIEKWNPEANSYIWVRIPELSRARNYIFAYWGNSEEIEPPSYTKNGATWSQGYAGVWHMSEPDARDSLNENNGRSNGSNNITGVIATAQQFTGGVDDSIVVEKITSRLNIKGSLSISSWMKPLSANNMLGIVTKGEGWGDYNLHLKGGSARPSFELKPFLPDAKNAPIGKTSLQPENWYHLYGTWDGSIAKIYVNGVEEAASSAKGLINTSSQILKIGAIERRYGPCLIDEVRISSVGRSAVWVWACWQSQGYNSDFCKYMKIDNIKPVKK